MEIQPLSIDQFQRDKDGKQVLIQSDVGNVAIDLQKLDKRLVLRVTESGGFVVFRREQRPNGAVKEELVTTATELDQRIVKRVEKIMSERYDLAGELDRLDIEAEKAIDYKRTEEISIAGERLAHALRKDLGVESDVARSRKNWGRG